MSRYLSQQFVDFFRAHAREGRPLALISVESTRGSTYSKAGALMLVNASGDFQGMVSGGCLEGDLAARAIRAIESGRADTVRYDLSDDDVFGFGVGCDGALSVSIQPLSAAKGYSPLADALETDDRRPRRVLLLGAGQDVDPLIGMSVVLGWHLTVVDHRPASIERLSGSGAHTRRCIPVDQIAAALRLEDYDAAVVMSHNLVNDGKYLRALAVADVGFVGLLGPPHRRDKLLAGLDGLQFGSRLRSPVGKPIGGRGAAAIALEIVAELQAYFSD